MIQFCNDCGEAYKPPRSNHVCNGQSCIMKGCTNQKYQGRFIGNLCVPCYRMITEGKIGYGETWIHKLKNKKENIRKKGPTKVIEECSELIKAVCKAERFGYFNYHPSTPYKNNIERIKEEMHDVIEAIEDLEKEMRHLGYVHIQI